MWDVEREREMPGGRGRESEREMEEQGGERNSR